MRTNTLCYVHIEAEVSMVDLASSKCFTKLCQNILTLTEPRANAQLVVKSVVIPRPGKAASLLRREHNPNEQALPELNRTDAVTLQSVGKSQLPETVDQEVVRAL